MPLGLCSSLFFFFNDTATTEIYTLSLHDALPIFTALSATTITVAETLTINGTADTTATLKRRGRKVIMPAAGSLVNRYFTIEEHESDISGSRLFKDCFWKSMKFQMAPNVLIMFCPS